VISHWQKLFFFETDNTNSCCVCLTANSWSRHKSLTFVNETHLGLFVTAVAAVWTCNLGWSNCQSFTQEAWPILDMDDNVLCFSMNTFELQFLLAGVHTSFVASLFAWFLWSMTTLLPVCLQDHDLFFFVLDSDTNATWFGTTKCWSAADKCWWPCKSIPPHGCTFLSI